ncbi:hypothetical protein JW948_07585 [bacterium]|nr:hypothetical protein [bacterium]
MIQKDYIMRLIEQAAQALAAILAKKESRLFEEARTDVKQAFQGLLGLDYELAYMLSPEESLTCFKNGDTLDIDRCMIVAELFRQDADIYGEQGMILKSISGARNALFFFLEVFLQQDVKYTEECIYKIEELISKLGSHTLPDAVVKRLMDYYELNGAYAKAENILFQHIESGDTELFETGRRFYERLLGKSDKELESGNLPRAEVREGGEALEMRRKGFGRDKDAQAGDYKTG